MIDLEGLTESIKEVALDAGHFINEKRKSFQKKSVQEKRSHDYVSYVDKESERLIVERLSSLLPEAGFIAEEGHGDFQNQDYCWLVDPLDGTTNFIHNQAPYCVSIALRDSKEIIIGVVYEMCRNELFWTYKGSPAFCNGEVLHVSDVSDYDATFLEIGLPYDATKYKTTALALMDELYGNIGGIRIIGACAAELCYIACGRFEGRIEANLGPWDVAAGSLILQQAGGKVTDFSGGDDFYSGNELVASNGKMHEFMLKSIKNSTHKRNNL
jgi:myo-inositol-1(or 4)-monophosphatase